MSTGVPAVDILVPLSVALPLGAAAILTTVSGILPAVVRDGLALVSAAGTAAIDGLLLARTTGGQHIYWFAGWRPAHGVVVGVDYAVGPMGAGFAVFAAALAAVALVYSRSFFDDLGGRYPALVLVFVAGITDFALSGDLFNLFVGFELVAITAVVLTGFFAEREAPLQGAINFAVTASIATLLFLVAIALLYDRTQTLNLAAMGQALAGRRLGATAVVAFALLATAFLTKAGVVPLHFWMPDAYGAAPVPVCLLFAGVMSEMGVFGLVRVWTAVYAGARFSGGTTGLAVGLGLLGALTALVGAAMAFRQRRLRRLLAFVTVAHSGLYLLGVGLLTPTAYAAVAVLALGDGFAKAGMFLAAGVVRQHSRRRAPDAPATAAGGGAVASLALLAVGALVLADLPPWASADGKHLLVAAAGRWGPAVEAIYAFSVIASSGAVVAAVIRGLRDARSAGPPVGGEEAQSLEEQRAGSGARGAVLLLTPAAVLIAAALAVGVIPGLDRGVLHAAAQWSQRSYYAAAVAGHRLPALTVPAAPATSAASVALGAGEAVCALLLGALVASERRAMVAPRALGLAATRWLRRLHTGHVGDQVAWQTVGAAALAALAGLALR